MMSEFNFKSQTCTSRVQSERLISLGLKNETADCYWFYCDIAKEWKCTILSSTQVFKDYPTTVIPAWSLDSLREMLNKSWVTISFIERDTSIFVERYGVFQNVFEIWDNVYDNICDCIEWLIKEGYFPKEYLENGTTEN